MRRLRRPLALGLTSWALTAMVTCAPPPPAPAVVVAPPAPVVSSPPVASLAPSAPPAPEPSRDESYLAAAPLAPDALLASLTAGEREQVSLLRAVCAPAIGDEGSKRRIGCFSCPSNSRQVTDRRTRLETSGASMLEPFTVLRGAFSAPGADERAVFFSTCSCFGCESEVYVLRPSPDGSFTASAPSLVLGAHHCQVLRHAGVRDRAVCRLDFGRGYMAQRLFVYDLSTPGSDTSLTPELEVVALDDMPLRCTAVDQLFEQRAITRWGLRDLDHDGNDDLEVEMDVHDGAMTPALLKQCQAASEPVDDQGKPARIPDAPRPPSRRVRLEWRSTRTGLVPTPATARSLAALAAYHRRSSPDD